MDYPEHPFVVVVEGHEGWYVVFQYELKHERSASAAMIAARAMRDRHGIPDDGMSINIIPTTSAGQLIMATHLEYPDWEVTLL